MILQYRNHPSVFLWGVRINESPDDDSLYEKTNALCRALDPFRPTGGVRCIKKSRLLEDVYTYNDFIYEGNNRPVSKKKSVMKNAGHPYLISEYMGHMFPTKIFDDEIHRRATDVDAHDGAVTVSALVAETIFAAQVTILRDHQAQTFDDAARGESRRHIDFGGEQFAGVDELMEFVEHLRDFGGGIFRRQSGADLSVVGAVEVVEDIVRELVDEMDCAAVDVEQDEIVALLEFVDGVQNFESSFD